MVQCTQPLPQLKLPESKITELTDDEDHDSPTKPEKTRMHHIERHRSCVVTLSDIELSGLQPRRLLQTIEKSPGGGSQCSLHEETPIDANASQRHAIVYFRDQPIGTVAAIDKSQGAALNYDQVFMRDFIPSALAFLMKGEHLIVKNFLVETARLQSREKMVDLFKLGQGLMPASFKVHHCIPTQKTESLLADFGETAIGRVAPVDSGLWWIILLRGYTKWTGDNSLAESPDCQRAMHLILRLCLSEGCDTSPALLCADGCSMIDRRMTLAKKVQCTQPPPQLKLPESKITELTDDENHDSPPKLEKRRMHHIERHRSCVVTLSDIELSGLQPRRLLQTIEKSPGGGSQCSLHEETPDANASQRHAIADAAWEALKRSIVYFRDQPIGTVAAIDKSQGAALNYDQVFMRDFIPSALAFLMKGEHLIAKNFLVETARLQSREKMVDLFKLGQGLMPGSFKVHHCNPTQKTESLLADFGETAIGRVAPVDSGLWWIILLRAYTKWTGDNSLAESPDCQRAMHLILRLCLSEGCDTSPALLCADGCSMIDRRMGIYGYPIEIQALFFMAMRCALSLLKQDSDADFVNHITKRIQALSYHLHSYYWLDFQRLNDIYRYKTEEYSQTALNKFNVIPESIPDWIFDFMPRRGGYFIGYVGPARMDFRWFCLGNFIAILSSLVTGEQAEAILDLAEERWQELIGEMPLKICYPAMENQEWQIVTGCDPKNTRWSYHNGGSWLVLWLLVAVSVKLGHPHLARIAVELMEQRLAKDLDKIILDVVEKRCQELIGEIPLKICNQEWQPATGSDPENPRWSSYNGGSLLDDNSMTNEWESDDFSKIIRKFRGLISIPRQPSNYGFISLDNLDRFLETYLTAIGQLRQCCEYYGIRIDLSDVGLNVVVFTTPPQGTFYFDVEYLGRIIRVPMNLRDLYLMGWSGDKGTYEMKMLNDESKNYIGEHATRLPIRQNYRFLAPGGIQNVFIGLPAWQIAFEGLYHATGNSREARGSIASFAVHLAEAPRLQSILKDICVLSSESAIETLDSRTKHNSLWINNYGHYGGQEKKRINSLCSRKVPGPIVDCSVAVDLGIQISESDILKQIRILPRDVGKVGVFECFDPPPSEPSEFDKLIKSRKREDTDTKGWKDPRKGRGGGGGGGSSSTGGAVGVGGSSALYLLEDWVQPQDETEPPSMKSSENKLWVQDFLDLFPIVQRFVTTERKEPIPPTLAPPSAIQRIPSTCLKTTPTVKTHLGVISGTPSAISKFPSVVKVATMAQKLLKHRWIKFLI